eukprot:gene7705-8542_t
MDRSLEESSNDGQIEVALPRSVVDVPLQSFGHIESNIGLEEQAKDLSDLDDTVKLLLCQNQADSNIQFIGQPQQNIAHHQTPPSFSITRIENDQSNTMGHSTAAGSLECLDAANLKSNEFDIFVQQEKKDTHTNPNPPLIDALYKHANISAVTLVYYKGSVHFAGPDHMQSLAANKDFQNVFFDAITKNAPKVSSCASSEAKKTSNKGKAQILDWSCDECKNSFATEHNLINHKLLKHSGFMKHKCQICVKEFVDETVFQRHLTTHAEDSLFQCKICGNAFPAKNLLSSHMKVHNEEKPYFCKVCAKGFHNSSSLQYHMTKHDTEKKCMCQHCKKEFTKMSSLKVHLRIHTGEQPYRCQECGKGFTVSTHLTRHLRVHSGEKPYLCEVCGKRFNRSSHLRIHFRIHSGEKPYECEICGKRFNQTVTCPGTLHLIDRNLVFVAVSIVAQRKRTQSVFASFPFIFNEKMVFERIFTNASTLDHVLEILEDEIVSIELKQYSERDMDGVVLARFEQPTRQFLFPGPTFVPKNDTKREVLLTRTRNFSAEKGIDPKMEFSTSTKIEETSIASNFREHLFSPPSYTVVKNSPSKIDVDISSTESSETEEEILITTPRKGGGSRCASANLQHCVCECPFRPENNGRVVIRSRSVSPGQNNMNRKKSCRHKPPFKVGKAPQDLISRRDFGDASLLSAAVSSPQNSSKSCPDCLVPHPQCSLCMAYKQTYGKNFLCHRFSEGQRNHSTVSSPKNHEDKTPKKTHVGSDGVVKAPKARARIPVSSPEPSSDEDSYRAALTVASSERRRNRARLFENQVSPAARTRGSRTVENVHSTVKGLLKKNDSVLQYELSNSDDESDVDDFVNSSIHIRESPLLTSSVKSFPDRSVVVPLGGEKFWSQKAHRYRGKSHREIFNDSLSEIYKDIYNNTMNSD